MNWYAIQVITGKETEVRNALTDFGIEVLLPSKPVFYKRSGYIELSYQPLIPGYIIAKMEQVSFYQYQRGKRIEKMMTRLCGNGYDAVPLNDEEISFINNCCDGMEPISLFKHNGGGIDILNPPHWAKNVTVDWYDIDKFKAKLRIRTSGIMKDHSFSIAAYDIEYSGKFAEQLQGLSKSTFGEFGRSIRQAIII
jgi:hypothetical protein